MDIDKEEKKPPTAETPSPQPKPKQEKETTAGSCNIKGNISSSGDKIFHVPGGEFYNVTEPEEMFCTKLQLMPLDNIVLRRDNFPN